MGYHPQGQTRSRIFFHILEKGNVTFDDIDYFMKRKLGLGKGKGLDTVKDALWPLLESQVIVTDNNVGSKSDRNIEKSTFSVRQIYGLVDLAIIYLNVYTWGREQARKFQKSTFYKEKISFNLEDLQKIITGNAESGILPKDYSFVNVLAKLPPEDPINDRLYFYCESTDSAKYITIKKILMNNVQTIGNSIRKDQPLLWRLILKRVAVTYTFSEWKLPIFKYLNEKLLSSPDYAMSFFRVIAEFLEETKYKELSIMQRLQKSPQGLQQLWATEMTALDSRILYYRRDSGLWPKDVTDAEIVTASRIRYKLSDDAPLANSKLYVVALFVIFLILHGTMGDHDRASIFSDLGISNEDLQSLIDDPISSSQMVSYENARALAEAEWIRDILPQKRNEVESILKQRTERIKNDPRKSQWSKEEAFALCMQRADLSIQHCYSLVPELLKNGYAIIRE